MEHKLIIKSKFIVPQLPEGVLITNRIRELGIEKYRVVSVVAPAGYGKTTAILASLCRRENLHWYRMDKEDSRLPIFYAHFLEALFGRVRKQEPESLQYFRSLSDLSQTYDLLNAAVCQDAWALFGKRIKKTRYLVLDDFHYASESEHIVQTIRYFLANMPPNLHFILISRTETGVLDGVQGLKGDALCLSAKELSFSEAEIGTYMKQHGLRLPPEMASVIYQNTEGWISGVVLIGSMATRLGPEEIGELLRPFGSENILARFFKAEVLRGLSAETIRCISIMATLEEFTVSDLETVFKMPEARTVVSYCEKTNLFLQKTVSDSETYRFHSLFRSFLLGLRNEHFCREEVEDLHIKACKLCLASGNYGGAVRHLLSANRMEDAVRLLCLHGRNMLDAGMGEHLKMLIEELPESVVVQNPYLSFYYGFVIVSTDFEQSCACLRRAIRIFEKMENADMQVQVMGVLFTAYAQRNDVVMIRQLVSEFGQLDEKIKSDEVRGTLLACRLGMAAFDENFQEGLALSQELESYILSDIWRYGINNFRTMIHYRLGNLAKGKRMIEKNLAMPIVRNNDQWKILSLVFCQNIAYYMGDWSWSAWVRNELLGLGEKYGSGYALGFGKKDAALARYIAHDIDQAVELINASAAHFRDYRNDAHVCRSVLYKNLWLLEKHSALVNPSEVLEACDFLVNAPVGQGFAETAQSFAGVILRETGDYEHAETLLLASFETSSRKQTLQSMAGTAMHLAKLYYDLNDHDKGDLYLRTFITITSSNRYVAFYDLFFPTLIEMAAYCVVKDMYADYAAELIEHYYGEKAKRYLLQKAAKLCSAKEAKLFASKFGGTTKSGTIIRVSMLGGFRVQIGCNEIPDTEWKTRKIQGILKYLLLNRDRFIHKEFLTELFWPDTDGKAAMASMNVAMYELRRVLSAYGLALDDKSPLICDHGNGYEIVSSDCLEIDADKFVRLYDVYTLYSSGGGDVRSVLTQLVDLYTGELLPQDIYEDWTMVERERIKSMFLSAAHRLTKIYMDEGSFGDAETLLSKALTADAYNEHTRRMLADLYRQTGRTNAAQEIINAFGRGVEK